MEGTPMSPVSSGSRTLTMSSTGASHLDCPICLSQYNVPRTLQCLHSFCENCLGSYIRKQSEGNTKLADGVACPVCRVVSPPPSLEKPVEEWAKLYPANHLLVSLLGSATEKKGNNCEACSDEENVKADFFCVDCQERLCNKCVEYHKKFKATKSHSLIRNEEFDDRKHQSLRLAESENCPQHKDEPIKFFCGDDGALCCATCVILMHRPCKLVQEVKEDSQFSATDINPSEMKDQMLQSCRQLTQIIDVIEDNIRNLKDQTTNIPNRINASRARVNNFFDEVESHLSKSSHTIVEDEAENCRKQSNRCRQIKAAIESSCDLLEKAQKYGTERQRFIVRKRAEEQCNQYDKLAKEESTNIRCVQLEFELEKAVESLLMEGSEQQVRVTSRLIPLLQVPLLKAPSSLGRAMVIQTNNANPGVPWYSGATFLPDGRVVLVDQTNKKVIVFDSHYHQLVEFNLPTLPWKVAAISSDEVVVSFQGEARIQILKIGPSSIQVSRSIDTTRPCWCVASVDDKTLAVVWDSDNHPAFGTLDIDGKEMSCFDATANGRQFKTFWHLGMDAKRGRVFQPCWKDDAVYCLDLSGKQLFMYTNEELKQPCGVDVDNDGNVYVCSLATDSIHRLTPSGQLVDITKVQGMYKPLDICFNNARTEFVVTLNEPSHREELHIFRLREE